MPDTFCRYVDHGLKDFVAALFKKAEMDADKASSIAHHLVEADKMGHHTHGLRLCGSYLSELGDGGMTGHGSFSVSKDSEHVAIWEGHGLPGPWLVEQGVKRCVAKALDNGLSTLVIRSSHHTACLATQLEAATNEGCMVVIACTGPSESYVAPFGGRTPVFNPAPFAVGIPTENEPILLDMSLAASTVGRSKQLVEAGLRFPSLYGVDFAGMPSDDPAAIFAHEERPAGAILPLGGVDAGHKGFGLLLFVESLTQGLGGYGRFERPSRWENSVFIQVFAPARILGSNAFQVQTSHLRSLCKASLPMNGVDSVRMPGELGLLRRREASANGVKVPKAAIQGLRDWSTALKVDMPDALGEC